MTPFKKKLLKPKEVSLDPSLMEETPIVQLPNKENELFDEDDDVGTSTIPELSLPSENDEEEVKSIMFVNMLLMSYLNFLHSILKENVSESGSNIKTCRLSNSFSNGMKMK